MLETASESFTLPELQPVLSESQQASERVVFAGVHSFCHFWRFQKGRKICWTESAENVSDASMAQGSRCSFLPPPSLHDEATHKSASPLQKVASKPRGNLGECSILTIGSNHLTRRRSQGSSPSLTSRRGAFRTSVVT